MIIKNKKAYFDYEIIQEFESGIVLQGHEVKSIRNGKISIKEGFCKVIKNEIFLFNVNISKFSKSNTFYDIDEKRTRKLLLQKKQILKIAKLVDEKGMTVIPLEVFFNENNKCKIKIGIGKGKKHFDKKDSIKEKDIQRDAERALKEYK